MSSIKSYKIQICAPFSMPFDDGKIPLCKNSRRTGLFKAVFKFNYNIKSQSTWDRSEARPPF